MFSFSRPWRIYPLAGPVSNTCSSGTERFRIATVSRKISGPLISFGVRPSFQPSPSFWKEPITTASIGIPSFFLTDDRVSSVAGVKYVLLIPIGILKTFEGSMPVSSTTSSMNRQLTWIRSIAAW